MDARTGHLDPQSCTVPVPDLWELLVSTHQAYAKKYQRYRKSLLRSLRKNLCGSISSVHTSYRCVQILHYIFIYIMSWVILRVFGFAPLALNAFHSNLEVYGKPYSFMGGGGEGVYETNPYKRSQQLCKVVLRLGYTKLTSWEVENLDYHRLPPPFSQLQLLQAVGQIFGCQCAPLPD